MAMSVTTGSTSPGREASHCGFEKVTISWTMDDSGIASDTISLTGAIREVILAPGTTAPSDTYVVRLYDPDNSSIDYACGGWTGHSDVTDYIEPVVTSDRCPVVCGPVVFHVSDANSSDADGVCTLFMKS